MTKQSLTTLALLFLVLSGCATQDPKPLTPQLIEPPPQVCSLVPCPLPGRPAPGVNEDITLALDETEAALLNCAVQVLDCMKKQAAATAAANSRKALPGAAEGLVQP